MPDPNLGKHALIAPAVQVRVLSLIKTLPADGTYDVTISQHVDSRSNAQLRLLWKWHGEWAEFYNQTRADRSSWIDKDEAHRKFKWRFVRPQVAAKDGGLARLLELASVDSGASKAAADLLTTNDLDVKEMSVALSEYDRFAQTRQCFFEHPDDLYHTAVNG